MPTYEYQCDACGHEFEKFQSMSAAPVKVCPSCGKKKVRKLFSTGAGLIFKGSGFYITDYRDSAYKDKAKADSGASGGETKSDAKPAETKTESAAPKGEPAPKSESATKSEPAPKKTEAQKPEPKSKKKKD